MRSYNLYKEQKVIACADGPGMETHKKPLALINVGWNDEKNASNAQYAVLSPIVAIQTPVSLHCWEETFDFVLCKKT